MRKFSSLMSGRVLTPLALALWLAGCASAPAGAPERALPPLPAQFSSVPTVAATPPPASAEAPAAVALATPEAATGSWTLAPAAEAQPRGAWWRPFMDPVLSDLVTRADLGNTRLQAAAARLAEARALLGTAEAARHPQVGANVGLQRQAGRGTLGGEQPSTTASLGLGASYEVDVMGRLSLASQAAQQDARAQAALLQSTRLMVQADVAQTYLQLRALQSEQALVDESLQALRDTLQLTTRRERAGDVAELDLARVRAEVASTEAESLALQRQQALLTHALAVLVGEVATGFSLPAPSADISLPVVPPGVPGTVLARRPDVAAAQAAVLAAQARVGVAQAAWFPAVTLTGAAGQASPELSDLFKWSARAWSVGALMSLPLWDGGRRESLQQGAQARLDAALAAYRGQVLTAFGEVEDQLRSLQLLAAQSEAQARAVASAQRATALSASRYRHGLVSQIEWLDARRAELRNRRAELQARTGQAVATVALVRALGGGWDGDGQRPAGAQVSMAPAARP
ncbi:efflux transporter outer membrane subunit [Curvibacter sp. HBC61]|uniref:Efflux transporter outer membrane subunit n=1 Tax=Curvibacter cyanobacteriorum TaxID=3026422 RepID=A0ABT5MWZ0_9BURK|nr:efflux transporter outer membrane subunit [Curvibacter sp. HBC61]MDD0838579.1 efflux transporter outer membrane subunit [Curvibacter sp. HBC61]